MKKSLTILLLLFTSSVLTGTVFGQQDFQKWLTYNNQTKISDKWGVTFDLNHRTKGTTLFYPSLVAARAGVSYFTPKNISLSAGYAWFGTYLEKGEPILLDENRIWQQLQVNRNYSKIQLIHRFRAEQRFIEVMPEFKTKIHSHDTFNRLRYALQLQGPIFENLKGIQWYTANEIMFNAGNISNGSLFNQNRTLAGLILSAGKQVDLSITYQMIYQHFPQTQNNEFINSGRFTILHKMDFSSK